MYVHFVLYVIAIVLVAIFWELSKINGRLKKALGPPPGQTTNNQDSKK